jgi:hypothetical protein
MPDPSTEREPYRSHSSSSYIAPAPCDCSVCTRDRARDPVTPDPDAFGAVSTGSYTPARSGQLRNIANGEYVFDVGTDLTRTLQVQLHTVRGGQLADQRILRRMGDDNRWDGFATLMEDGTVYIWRRHGELRDTREHRVLNTQFRTMHHQGTRIPSGNTTNLNGHAIALTQRRCNSCNRATTGSMAYCGTCLLNQPPSVTVDERQYDVNRPRPTVTPRATVTTDSATFTTRRASRTATPAAAPLMSEIDPTRIR